MNRRGDPLSTDEAMHVLKDNLPSTEREMHLLMEKVIRDERAHNTFRDYMIRDEWRAHATAHVTARKMHCPLYHLAFYEAEIRTGARVVTHSAWWTSWNLLCDYACARYTKDKALDTWSVVRWGAEAGSARRRDSMELAKRIVRDVELRTDAAETMNLFMHNLPSTDHEMDLLLGHAIQDDIARTVFHKCMIIKEWRAYAAAHVTDQGKRCPLYYLAKYAAQHRVGTRFWSDDVWDLCLRYAYTRHTVDEALDTWRVVRAGATAGMKMVLWTEKHVETFVRDVQQCHNIQTHPQLTMSSR